MNTIADQFFLHKINDDNHKEVNWHGDVIYFDTLQEANDHREMLIDADEWVIGIHDPELEEERNYIEEIIFSGIRLSA